MWYYYNNSVRPCSSYAAQLTPQTVLFLFCFFNELFFVCLYLNKFVPKPILYAAPLKYLLTDRVVIAIQQYDIGRLVLRGLSALTWPQFVGAISFLPCATKQVINAVQFWKASKIVSRATFPLTNVAHFYSSWVWIWPSARSSRSKIGKRPRHPNKPTA